MAMLLCTLEGGPAFLGERISDCTSAAERRTVLMFGADEV